MKQLRLLLTAYARGLFGVNKLLHSKEKNAKVKLALYTALALFVIASVMMTAGGYCYLMIGSFSAIGQASLTLLVMLAMSCLMCAFATMYKASGVLIMFEDYDLQMSLPIPSRVVALSRLLIEYLLNLAISLIVMLPAICVYGWFERPDFGFYIAFLGVLLTSPMIPIVLASVVGVLIARVSRRTRASKYVNIALSMTAFLVYMFAVTRMNSEEVMVSFATGLYDKVSAVYPPLKLYQAYLLNRDVGALALFMVISVAVFAAAGVWFGFRMKHVHSAMISGGARGKYRMRTLRATTALKALYRREMGRYFASSLYVMNTAIGLVMSLAAVIALAVAKDSLIGGMGLTQEMIGAFLPALPFGLSMLLATCCTTGSSVSLEGKRLWITKTIPVSAMDVFHAKLMVNAVLVYPLCVIEPIILAVIFKTNFAFTLLMLLLPAAYASLTMLLGLVMNLKMPNFEWKNEATVIKQSLPSGLPMLFVFPLTLGPAALIVMMPQLNAILISVCALAVATAVSAALYAYLRKNAEKLMRAL